MRPARGALPWALAVAVAACGPSVDAPTVGALDRSGPEGLPANAPARFGFGADASPDRVAMWDIDIRPDGAGLPPGSGTVEDGRQVYEAHCAECHGATGTEGPNDRLVGTGAWGESPPSVRTIGNYWQHATTLFDYVRRAMPHLTPGLLTDEETYGVVAYLLHLNEIVPADAVMNAETLPAVVMPARDRFVPDDRQGGDGEVR